MDTVSADKRRKAVGKGGEDVVSAYLTERGYKIAARNYHSRYGEIDIIAEKDDFIAFVEVKTRKENSLVQPFEAITKSKQKKIILTAVCYLNEVGSELQPRFDAAAVTYNKESYDIEYITDAFTCEGVI